VNNAAENKKEDNLHDSEELAELGIYDDDEEEREA